MAMRELTNIVYTILLGASMIFGILALADVAIERQNIICQEGC